MCKLSENSKNLEHGYDINLRWKGGKNYDVIAWGWGFCIYNSPEHFIKCITCSIFGWISFCCRWKLSYCFYDNSMSVCEYEFISGFNYRCEVIIFYLKVNNILFPLSFIFTKAQCNSTKPFSIYTFLLICFVR